MALPDPVFIAEGGFQRLRELQRLLDAQAIEADIVGPPDRNLNK